MKRRIGLLFRVGCLLLAWGLLPGCAGLAPAEQGRGHPTLWRAERPATGPVYLLGSVHLGRPQPLALGPGFERVWQRADELVLEVDLSLYGEAEGRRLMDRYGRVPTPGRLRDRVAPRTWALFQAYLEKRGMSAAPLEPYQPWLVATLIAVLEFHALGYDPEHGVDRVLLAQALADGKPVSGMETLESQFAMLAGLPDAVQDVMLRDMLARADDFAEEASQMLDAWREGRDRELTRIVFRNLGDEDFAAFYESILFERNRLMAARVEELAADGKTRLVVAGAAHMLGSRGIPALLAERGFDVEVLE